MEIENTKEATVIELKNNRVFIGVYMVPLFTLIGLIISKITIYSILMCLTIFIFLNIGNYIAIRNIGSIETLTLNNVSLTIRRLKKNKKPSVITACDIYQNCKVLIKRMALVTATGTDCLIRYTMWYMSDTLAPAINVLGMRDTKSDIPNNL